MYRGDKLLAAMLVIPVLDFVFLIVLVFTTTVFGSEDEAAPAFVPKPKDRPVLESVQQVWNARTTGVCEFDFDGVHYVVTNLPKEYVDYSAWYVRLP